MPTLLEPRFPNPLLDARNSVQQPPKGLLPRGKTDCNLPTPGTNLLGLYAAVSPHRGMDIATIGVADMPKISG